MSTFEIIKNEIKSWGFLCWLFMLLVVAPVSLLIFPFKTLGALGDLLESVLLRAMSKIPKREPKKVVNKYTAMAPEELQKIMDELNEQSEEIDRKQAAKDEEI